MDAMRNSGENLSQDFLPRYERRTLFRPLPLHELPSNSMVESYPEISCDLFGPAAACSLNTSMDGRHCVVTPSNEGVLKRLIRTLFECGFSDALDELRELSDEASLPLVGALVGAMAGYAYQLVHILNQAKAKVFPNRIKHGVAGVAQVSETRDWMHSAVRVIVWHPNCFKIAVAGCDDVVRIYTDEPSAVPILRSPYQKWISAMAFRPFAAAELAVACQIGICLWTVDNHHNIMRSSIQLLQQPNHAPVTSVQWNPDGTLLATASINNSDVILWQVDQLESTPLRRVGPPCSLLKWSPCGEYLFAGTVGNVFRVWSTVKDWTPDRWSLKPGVASQSACWSPCSKFLLFVTSAESLLYCLDFTEEYIFTKGSTPREAQVIADVAKFPGTEETIGSSGQPRALAWDPNGRFLAVLFKNLPHVAVYNTCIQRFNLHLSPFCVLPGADCDEFPSFICFQSKTATNVNSVLTIGWSSGKVEYRPFTHL